MIGAFATIAARLAAKAAGLVFLIVLARLVAPEEFAAYSYLVALAITFYVFADSGIGWIVSREHARGDLTCAEAYGHGIAPTIVTSLLGAALLVGFALAAGGPGAEGLPLLGAAVMVCAAGLFAMQAAILRAAGRQVLEAGLQVAGAVAFVVVATVVAAAGLGLGAVMLVFAGREVVLAIVAHLLLPRPALRKGSGRLGIDWALVRGGIRISASASLLVFSMRGPLIALGIAGSVDEVARYSVAVRANELQVMVAQTVGYAFMPLMARDFAAGDRQGRRRVRTLMLGAVGAAVPLGILGVLLAPWIVPLLFGERYDDAVVPTALFAAMMPVALVAFVAWYALVAMRREHHVLVANVGAALATAAGIVVIVANPDAVWAAAMTVLPLVVMCVILCAGLRSRPAPPAPPSPARAVEALHAATVEPPPGPMAAPPPPAPAARVAPEAASPYEVLAAREPTHVTDAGGLARMTAELAARAEPLREGCLIACVQDIRRVPPDALARLMRLAGRVPRVVLVGLAVPPEPAPGVVGVELGSEDVLRAQWALVVVGPDLCEALVALDLGDPFDAPRRRFRWVRSDDAELVKRSAAALLERAGAAHPAELRPA